MAAGIGDHCVILLLDPRWDFAGDFISMKERNYLNIKWNISREKYVIDQFCEINDTQKTNGPSDLTL